MNFKFSIYLSVFISSMRILVLESGIVSSYTVTSLRLYESFCNYRFLINYACTLSCLLHIYLDVLLLQYWTESFVQWSPLGTYLATLHTKGSAVWGGPSSFNRLNRFEHKQVCLSSNVHYCFILIVAYSLDGVYCR